MTGRTEVIAGIIAGIIAGFFGIVGVWYQHYLENPEPEKTTVTETAQPTETGKNTQQLEKFLKRAEKGNAVAQFKLGVLYTKGEEVERDLTQAAEWYRKAAEQGHKNAQFKLGRFYEKGKGLEADLTQAEHWYQKAAEQGHKNAQKSLELLSKQ
ncbi:MAG: tetratricopeptide repeat protein [Candidatus Parabeggiatoa sp.]|nr:tetratricopeptide repeat protein [Candidatus Parabeggiatoa sp.]